MIERCLASLATNTPKFTELFVIPMSEEKMSDNDAPRDLDQDTTKALTQTPVWTAYLDSRRALEHTRTDVEKFAEIMKNLSEDTDQ